MRFSIIVTMLFLWPLNALGETTAFPPFSPCSTDGTTEIETLKAEVECLRGRIDELKQAHNILLQAQIDTRQKLDDTAREFKVIVYGPPKKVQRLAASKQAVTISYWAAGAKKRVFNCVSPASPKSGMTLVGAKLSGPIRINALDWASKGATSYRGCAKHEHCDSAGEFCDIQSRTSGCYVNSDWLAWFTNDKSSKGLGAPTKAEICAG